MSTSTKTFILTVVLSLISLVVNAQSAPEIKSYKAFYFDADGDLVQVENVADAKLKSRCLVYLGLKNNFSSKPVLFDKDKHIRVNCNASFQQPVSNEATTVTYYGIAMPEPTIGTQNVLAVPLFSEQLGAETAGRTITCVASSSQTPCAWPKACHCPLLGGNCPTGCCW